MKVLMSNDEITMARAEMMDRDISYLDKPRPQLMGRAMKALNMDRPVVGDYIKSWDVLETVKFLEANTDRQAPILDIGCYASEVTLSLYKAGFTNLTGIDLDPNVSKMPLQDQIRFVVGDFMKTDFEDESFQAITSISVIEHGFNPAALLSETSRLLKPGGYFIASFDYWPEKIETAGIRIFGMDWLIFSKDDVDAMVSEAANHGLFPVGEMNHEGQERPIKFSGFEYTFGWLALEKRN